MPPKRKRQGQNGTTSEAVKVEASQGLAKAAGKDETRRYFLMKAEPESRIEAGVDVKFSIDDLKKVDSEPWDGVRNAEASKTMRERMKKGDLAFFYHSNTKMPGIAGIAEIVKEGYPDSSAWTKGHPYYDAKTNQEKPKWFRVDVKYVRHTKRFLSLHELKTSGHEALKDMQLLRRPQLSVQQVSPAEWDCIMEMEQAESEDSKDDTKPSTPDKKGRKPRKKPKKEIVEEPVDDEQVKAEIRDTHGGH